MNAVLSRVGDGAVDGKNSVDAGDLERTSQSTLSLADDEALARWIFIAK